MAANYWGIAVGSALGGMLRFWLASVVTERASGTFPWGTLIVNFSGSFLIGFIFTFTSAEGRATLNATARHFLMTGICGGYTTFSSFSLQTLNLAQNGEWVRAGLNIVASVVLCLVAVWLGHTLALAFNR